MTDKIIEAARAAGMTASIGQTTNGKYKPNVNALGRSVPVEWLERFYALARAEALEDAAKAVRQFGMTLEHDDSDCFEEEIRALPSQQDHSADANKLIDRHTLQAQGKHPAPCARFCEANAFRIEERQQARLIAELEAQVTALTLETERTARNRDMWKGQTQRQADRLHALHSCMAALKRLLARDPCAHAGTAIQMIDAAIALQPNGQAEGEPPCSPS